jgi:hypothetical protein
MVTDAITGTGLEDALGANAKATITPRRYAQCSKSARSRQPAGSQWHVSSVANLLARASKLEAVR